MNNAVLQFCSCGSLFPRVLVSGFLLGALAGCSQPAKPTGTEEEKTTTSDSVSVSAVDLNSLNAEIKAVAKTRVDGNGQIIEVDLRGSSDVAILSRLSQLPKLRSVLLSDSGVGDHDMDSIAQIATLENLDLRGCAMTNEGLQPLSKLTRLKAIKLSGKGDKTRITDQGLDSLAAVTSLKVVALDFLPISDQGVEKLLPLQQLRELFLAGTYVTDQSASALTRFPELAKLRLASTQFGDGGLREMSALSSLDRFRELDVSDCAGITSESIPLIAGMNNLAKLNLYNTAVDDARWDALSRLQKLTWLNVDKTSVSDASMSDLGKLASLTFLHLGSTKISDAGMNDLASLVNLKKLIVTRTKVTAAGVASLNSKLPETEIQLEYVAPE